MKLLYNSEFSENAYFLMELSLEAVAKYLNLKRELSMQENTNWVFVMYHELCQSRDSTL